MTIPVCQRNIYQLKNKTHAFDNIQPLLAHYEKERIDPTLKSIGDALTEEQHEQKEWKAERLETLKREAERQEAVRQEAERQRQEAERLKAKWQEAERQEAERQRENLSFLPCESNYQNTSVCYKNIPVHFDSSHMFMHLSG